MVYGEWEEELVLQAGFLMGEDVLTQSVRVFWWISPQQFMLVEGSKMPIYWIHSGELLGCWRQM